MTNFSASLPTVEVNRIPQSRRPAGDLSGVAFASIFSDHMFVAEYEDGRWARADIRPYGPLELLPNVSALQYGISVFEGLKAQRTADGRVALFRPRQNARRLNQSAARLAMAELPDDLFETALLTLLDLDREWVPPSGQGALYVRPCLFSIDPAIRVKPAERFLFTILTFPFGTYYAGGVDALVTERYVRAFPGGTGAVKPAGNYAPTLAADLEAQAQGCQTVLWLDGLERRYVEECGVMNVFFVAQGERGPVVITPALGGTILPGITRDSVLTLLRDDDVQIEERAITIEEVLGLLGEGRLLESFGTGTAATLSHIRSLTYRGQRNPLPDVGPDSVGAAVRDRLQAIARGTEPDRFNWLTFVDGKRESP
jgi:branched-chain amino acid aminotransferase